MTRPDSVGAGNDESDADPDMVKNPDEEPAKEGSAEEAESD
jgi:hypothetical protein